MQRLLAIAGLTWKAAFRFRLFVVIAVLLLGSVVGLPLLIKDDGTARGCTQILLTYTLSVITVLLGLSTLWLSCGLLARDIEECQIQVVAVKPVARWQIWLGKWLGIMALNAVMLALSGASVYGLLLWRAARLPAEEQKTLRREVLVARGSLKPPTFEREIEAETDRLLEERLKQGASGAVNLREVRREIREQVKARDQLVPPSAIRQWEIHLGLLKSSLRDQPLHLRIKFNAADKSPSGTFIGLWQVGAPRQTQLWRSQPMSLAPDTFHEFEIPPNLFDENGVLTISFANVNNTSLLFPLEDGIEVLYREGGFGLNFARGVGIIFCWMALLAALGLTAASFLSFPVAAFFSLGVLTVALSSGTLANVVSDRTIMGFNAETGVAGHSIADTVIVPAFSGILYVIHLATQTATIPEWFAKLLPAGVRESLSGALPSPARPFSPVDALSTGRSIAWTHLGLAFVQIVLLLGGIIGLIGTSIFNRRELATAQGTQ
jgi:hypothetical protein